MADGVTITTDYVRLDSRLLKLASRLSDPTPMLEEIGIIGEREIKQNFKQGGRPNKWKTSARARKQGGQTLMDTGDLRGSVSHQVIGKEVAVGSNKIKGPILHFGGIIKAKNAKFLRFKTPDGWITTKSVTMPARPWLVLTESAGKKFNSVIKSHVE